MISVIAEAKETHITKVTFHDTPKVKFSILTMINDFFFL